MNMIDKIAKNMREAVVLPGTEQEQFRAYAKIALETLKEPTEEMIDASRGNSHLGQPICYQKMIEAALKG